MQDTRTFSQKRVENIASLSSKSLILLGDYISVQKGDLFKLVMYTRDKININGIPPMVRSILKGNEDIK